MSLSYFSLSHGLSSFTTISIIQEKSQRMNHPRCASQCYETCIPKQMEMACQQGWAYVFETPSNGENQPTYTNSLKKFIPIWAVILECTLDDLSWFFFLLNSHIYCKILVLFIFHILQKNFIQRLWRFLSIYQYLHVTHIIRNVCYKSSPPFHRKTLEVW